MKKILLCTIMIVLCIGLTGCSGSKNAEKDSANQTQNNQSEKKDDNKKDKDSVNLEKNELIELVTQRAAIKNSNYTVRSQKYLREAYRYIAYTGENCFDTLIFENLNDQNIDDDLNQDTKIFITTKSVDNNSVKLEDIANTILPLRHRITKLSYKLQDTEGKGDFAFTETKEKIQGRDTIIQEGTLSCFGKKISNYVAYEFYLEDGTICEFYVSSPFYDAEKLRETAEIMISSIEEQKQSAFE